MRVTDVPVDERARCDACGKRIKARQHELAVVDPEGDQTLGRYHASDPRECWRAAEKYTASEYGPDYLDLVHVHPQRCGKRLQRCDGGEGDVKAKKEKKK